ncbi:MAG: hypothetical protein J3K34DRAFT_425160 [Monoraphidium minutum]|nr:MAG: hypothetical protein J3K34DRAFT_425160 [Monoraphidium minutum]
MAEGNGGKRGAQGRRGALTGPRRARGRLAVHTGRTRRHQLRAGAGPGPRGRGNRSVGEWGGQVVGGRQKARGATLQRNRGRSRGRRGRRRRLPAAGRSGAVQARGVGGATPGAHWGARGARRRTRQRARRPPRAAHGARAAAPLEGFWRPGAGQAGGRRRHAAPSSPPRSSVRRVCIKAHGGSRVKERPRARHAPQKPYTPARRARARAARRGASCGVRGEAPPGAQACH